MRAAFHPELVNDAFGDPALFLDMSFEGRALLADLGDLGKLSPRKILRVSHVFVSHTHIDHFVGFDRLLRVSLGRARTVTLCGPSGLIEQVGNKLRAYTWNLVGNYPNELVFQVVELEPESNDWRRGPSPRLLRRTATFRLRNGFRPDPTASLTATESCLLDEENLVVHTAVLDHGVPSMAYSFAEKEHAGVVKSELLHRGLPMGAWLRGLRRAVLSRQPDDTAIEVPGIRGSVEALPLSALRSAIRLSRGQKVAYVADTHFTPAVVDRVTALAENADILFCEAAFAHADVAEAEARGHLTARQAGELARLACVKRLIPLHFSPRYEGREHVLRLEAQAAFEGIVE